VLAGVASTAGVLAYRAQQEAVAQRNRAEQTLAAATETANNLIFDLAQRFKEAVGVSAALRKDILERARKLQEQLTASNEMTPALARSEAAALDELAAALLAVGDTQGAYDAADRARQITEGLLTANPENEENLRDFSVTIQRIGDVLKAQGKLEEAL